MKPAKIVIYEPDGTEHVQEVPRNTPEQRKLAKLFDEIAEDEHVKILGRKIYWPKPLGDKP